MADYRRGRREDNSTLWLVLGLVGGGVLVILALCGGIVYLVTSTVRSTAETGQDFVREVAKIQQQQMAVLQAQRTAWQFLDDCLGGRAGAAYAVTTPGFRKRMTQEQFKDLLAKHPVMQQGPLNQAEVRQPIPNVTQYRLDRTTPEGRPVTFLVTLAQDGGAWKVDQFQVEGP